MQIVWLELRFVSFVWLCVCLGGREGFLEKGQNIVWKTEDKVNCWVVEVMDRLCILIKSGDLNCLFLTCESLIAPSEARVRTVEALLLLDAHGKLLPRTSLIWNVHGG